MSTLYLTEQGTKLRKASRRLVVEKDGTTILEVPSHEVERVLVFGAVQMSTQAMTFLLESGTEVSFLSMTGRLKGKLAPAQSKNVFLRLAQYERSKDEEFKLSVARTIVQAKIKNQRTLLLRHQRNHPDADFSSELASMSEALSSVPQKKGNSSLMGLEGVSSGAYFRCFARMLSPEFAFDKRLKHPATDPVNALLSLGYVLVTNELAGVAESVGFDPFIGFLHGLRYGRQSLALDLVEEFRQPVVDGLVLTEINKRMVKQADFERGADGACYLKKEVFGRFLASYEDRLESTFLYKSAGAHTSYRKLFRSQVEDMERAVLNRGEYHPFLVQ